MTKTELREIIANGRNSGVEFKRDVTDGHELAKDVVAFANGWGGRILLGVDDDGRVHGLRKSDHPSRLGAHDTGQHSYRWLDQLVMQTCRDKIQPAIVPYVDVYRDVVAGRAVAVVETTRGWNMHHVLHHQHRTCYIRAGSSSREVGPDAVKRQFPIRGRFRPELRPVSGTSIADLDRRRLMDYFNRVRGQNAPLSWPSAEWRQGVEAWARREDEKRWRTLVEYKEQEWHETRQAEWESLLVNTEILDDGNRRAATVAGLMLFGKDPGRFLPQAKIDAVACFGSEKDYAVRERDTLRGPIVHLKGVDGPELEPGLVEQAVRFVRRNIGTVTSEDGVRRRERWDYPEEVIREAVVDAIVHRDYLLSGSDIELSIYSDRLEIVSPGRLANGITPDRMRVGCRSARNELLKDVMRDYGYLEQMGMGVPRKIIRGMREHNGTEPDLIEEDERFTVRLWKDPPG
ncbi:MAG: putative DNA binding domain-containing protein [Gammaproteobacteria bacterium]|nr:putative DNA binding domain-containing protein [Gammaproteobacteria bacterium]